MTKFDDLRDKTEYWYKDPENNWRYRDKPE